jgi:hypothetical protein
MEVQPIVDEAQRGQKMDFQSPGIESPGGRAPGIGRAGGQAPMKQTSWGRVWVLKLQGLNKESWLGLGIGALPRGVKRNDLAL